MKYYIRRDLNEYGPYTLADLQRYVAQGNVSPSDLTRSEGMTDWVPVSQVIGNIPAPFSPAAPAVGAVYGGPVASTTPYSGGVAPSMGGTVYGGVPVGQTAVGMQRYPQGPVPPDFHWALVLLISAFCGFFQIAWLFVEVSFVRKLNRAEGSMLFLLSGIAVQVFAVVILVAVAAQGQHDTAGFTVFFWLLFLGGGILQIISYFKMRSALLEYYNTVEPINLQLSGVLTFFFAVYYFQYHFSRIAHWKKTGYLSPQ